MLFRRRNPPKLGERIRVALWPRHSWSRSARYLTRRMQRLGGSPHVIALGIGAGAFAACLPYWGIQFLAAGLIAWAIRGNIGAAMLGTFVANPVTYPLIGLLSYKLGNAMLGGSGTLDPARMGDAMAALWPLLWSAPPEGLAAAGDILWPLVMPMSIGALPLGLMTALIFYYTSRRMVEAYQCRHGGCG